MKARETMQLTNTLSSNNRNLTWVSTNSKVAVVSEGGVVTAVSEGYVSIYAYPNNDKQNVVHYYLNVSGIGEADYISRFIHVALEENGTHETGDNIQKYGEWYPNNGAPWCAMFVSWCWYQAGLTNDILCKYQGCYTGMKWCTEKGIMHFVQDYTFAEALEGGVSSKQYAEDYRDSYEVKTVNEYFGPARKAANLVKKATFNGWLLPADKKIIALSPVESPFQAFRKKKVVLFEPFSGKAVLAKKDWKQMWLACGLYRDAWRLMKKHKSAAEKYRNEIQKFTCMDAWKQYLEIEKGTKK